jgi:predicted DNA-binding protein (MmcQ/YjbR family)
MNIEEFREYCLAKKASSEDFPFGPETLVLRVGGKIFAITGLDRAVELREQYAEVQPGFHMNKTHWNTVHFEGGLDNRLLRELIDHSYDLVAASLKKADKEALGL